jgi:hypothetical protein
MLGEEIVDEHDEVINLQELARKRAQRADPPASDDASGSAPRP